MQQKHVSFDTEIVKDGKDVHCSDPPPVADKGFFAVLTQSMKMRWWWWKLVNFCLKQQSNTGEYEDNDCSDNEVHQIPCSQIRDVCHMLQRQNACCNFDNFDKPYEPMNLTHLDSPHGDDTEDEQEEEEEQDVKEEEDEDEEGETNGNGTGEDSNNGVSFYFLNYTIAYFMSIYKNSH